MVVPVLSKPRAILFSSTNSIAEGVGLFTVIDPVWVVNLNLAVVMVDWLASAKTGSLNSMVTVVLSVISKPITLGAIVSISIETILENASQPPVLVTFLLKKVVEFKAGGT